MKEIRKQIAIDSEAHDMLKKIKIKTRLSYKNAIHFALKMYGEEVGAFTEEIAKKDEKVVLVSEKKNKENEHPVNKSFIDKFKNK